MFSNVIVAAGIAALLSVPGIEISDYAREKMSYTEQTVVSSAVENYCKVNSVDGDVVVTDYDVESCVITINDIPHAIALSYLDDEVDYMTAIIENPKSIMKVVYNKSTGNEKLENVTLIEHGAVGELRSQNIGSVFFDNSGNILEQRFTTVSSDERIKSGLTEYGFVHGIEGLIRVVDTSDGYIIVEINGVRKVLKKATRGKVSHSEDGVIYLSEEKK